MLDENIMSNSDYGGYIQVTNSGAFMASFGVFYYLNGRYFKRNVPMLPVLKTARVYIPKGATQIQVGVSIAVYWSSWRTIYLQNFTTPPTKCFNLTGIVWYATCTEIPCSPGVGDPVPPVSPCPCPCCCNCCCK